MNATYTPLCRYQYDPLDRLATCSPAEQNGIQRFYQKKRLTTEIQGQIQRAFFQTEDQLLAQHQGPNNCTLLASDQQRSVLDGINDAQRQSTSYTPYGVRHPQTNALGLLGFTGERADPVTGHYLLGNGYRAFNPVLMRFNSPDSLSPFGEGELNAYAYCTGDPVNRTDPTGQTWAWVKAILRPLGLMSKSTSKSVMPLSIKKTNSIRDITATIELPEPIASSPPKRTFSLSQGKTSGKGDVGRPLDKGNTGDELLEKLMHRSTKERKNARISRREKIAAKNERLMKLRAREGAPQDKAVLTRAEKNKIYIAQVEGRRANDIMNLVFEGIPDLPSNNMSRIRGSRIN